MFGQTTSQSSAATASTVPATTATTITTTIVTATADNKDTIDNKTEYQPLSTILVVRDKDIVGRSTGFRLQNDLWVRGVTKTTENGLQQYLQVCDAAKTTVYAEKLMESAGRLCMCVVPHNHIFYRDSVSERIFRVTGEVNADGTHNVAFNIIMEHPLSPGLNRDKYIEIGSTFVLKTGDMWIEFSDYNSGNSGYPILLRLTLQGFLTALESYNKISDRLVEVEARVYARGNETVPLWFIDCIECLRDKFSEEHEHHLKSILNQLLASFRSTKKLNEYDPALKWNKFNPALFYHCIPADQLIAGLDSSVLGDGLRTEFIVPAEESVVVVRGNKLGFWRCDPTQANDAKQADDKSGAAKRYTHLETKDLPSWFSVLHSLNNNDQFTVTYPSENGRKVGVWSFATRSIATSCLIKSTAKDSSATQTLQSPLRGWRYSVEPLSNGTTFVGNLPFSEQKNGEDSCGSHMMFFDTVTREAVSTTYYSTAVGKQLDLTVLSDDSVVAVYGSDPQINIYRCSFQSLVNLFNGVKGLLLQHLVIPKELIEIIVEYIALIKDKINANDKNVVATSSTALRRLGSPAHVGAATSTITIEEVPPTVTPTSTATDVVVTNTAAAVSAATFVLPPFPK